MEKTIYMVVFFLNSGAVRSKRKSMRRMEAREELGKRGLGRGEVAQLYYMRLEHFLIPVEFFFIVSQDAM